MYIKSDLMRGDITNGAREEVESLCLKLPGEKQMGN